MRLTFLRLGLALLAAVFTTSCKSTSSSVKDVAVEDEEVFCTEGPILISSRAVYYASDRCNFCSCKDFIPDEDPMLVCTTKLCEGDDLAPEGCVVGGVLLAYDTEVPGNDDCRTYRCNKDGQIACIEPRDHGDDESEKRGPVEAPKPEET